MSHKEQKTNTKDIEPQMQYFGYLINPFDQTITTIKISRKNELKQLRETISAELIDRVVLNDKGDMLIVDDEGLFVDEQAFFYINNRRLAGKSLIVGAGEGGEFASPSISLDWARERTSFVPEKFRQWLETYLEEKGIDALHVFNFDTSGGFFQIHLGEVINILCSQQDDKIKQWAMYKLTEYDSNNKNPIEFFELLAQMIYESNLEENSALEVLAEHP